MQSAYCSQTASSFSSEQAVSASKMCIRDRGYGAWREVLITHTVHSADNPYLPGSPYYKAPAA